LLPGAASRWRVPGWMVGIKGQKSREDFEGLRRRLEGEQQGTGVAAATGSDGRVPNGMVDRRTLGRQLLDQFRGNPE